MSVFFPGNRNKVKNKFLLLFKTAGRRIDCMRTARIKITKSSFFLSI